ncbi:2-C-methyl-D-erythritol 4-phosphate cytidylyltransferase [Pedobacter rhizosphaerae]|uniref:2-C-methyl-D-erythritol 4-phosphate cytidylyltransferase n=1 Tax=Pedobacter rhizosphaerae TaxID=390241 RepID=A0A1H9LZ69_9SPHI|nr:2-C-methyl-D-erythritol 4-phosphate cytidylyltransferase [Pedobacter rhizosphaerae]SER16487.1 2-C-methyl-D-erythritol 4-phosphate cytidylyltransferase [Pedobacter rhizosphaerae]
MKNYAIIVAGGSGNRMQTETPKQFLLLNNLPVLMHTIKAFAQSESQPKIFLVLNTDQHQNWLNLCKEFNFQIPHEVIDGGKERFYSVKSALDQIDGEGLVAIHDAVRPLVSKALIDSCYYATAEKGNAVAAVKPTDSIRKIKGAYTEAVNREDFYLIQTPQTFNLQQIKKAYLQPFTPLFTDDASVAEQDGVLINLVEGDKNNIKITYPTDLDLAEILINKKAL